MRCFDCLKPIVTDEPENVAVAFRGDLLVLLCDECAEEERLTR